MSALPLSIDSLARAEVRALPLYAPDARVCDIDLSDSTNLWGPPPAAVRAIARAAATSMAPYPSLRSDALGPALLRFAGVDRVAGARVVTGCGSDDVIDSAMRAFGATGDRVAFSVPTFSMIPIFAALNGLQPVAVPFASDMSLDADRLVDAGAKLTYLCAPNNPTGTSLSRDAVEYVATHARGIVLLDEAYVEFAPESFVDLVARHERLLVTRTFSKAFGLAGLRVGYGIGAEALIAMLERARGPYKVTSLAEQAVLASLDTTEEGLGWVRTHVGLAVQNRDRLSSALAAFGLTPLPSAANFVFIPSASAAAIARGLRERGVLVRLFSGLPRDLPFLAESDGAAIRVGVGPWPLMQSFLDALPEALRCE